jgi:hypothetical protein
MKQKKSFHLISGVLILFILSLALPSCASMKAKSHNTQKRGLMLQDKSQYKTNKGNFKQKNKHGR